MKGVLPCQVDRQSLFVEQSVPSRYQPLTTRAFAAKCSPRAAIKAKCLDCCHYEKEEVANCTVTICPLHAFRPFQT